MSLKLVCVMGVIRYFYTVIGYYIDLFVAFLNFTSLWLYLGLSKCCDAISLPDPPNDIGLTLMIGSNDMLTNALKLNILTLMLR